MFNIRNEFHAAEIFSHAELKKLLLNKIKEEL